MKRPAIFFDRDNTLIVSDGYLGDPEQVKLMEGAAEAVARARSLGFATVTISNQSGVARGLFGEDAVRDVNKQLDAKLKAVLPTAVIDRHEFCPFHPEATVERYKQESDLRKPKPGMILAAAEALALDLSRSWVIGDAPRDVQAGQAVGCRTILLQAPGLPPSPAADEKLLTPADQIVTTLKEAMDFIEKSPRPVDPADPGPTPPTDNIAPKPSAPVAPAPNRLEHLAEQLLFELRKRNEDSHYSDFSVSKLMAGIVQVLTLAILFIAYLNRSDTSFVSLILTATYFQTFVIALLIMGRQR